MSTSKHITETEFWNTAMEDVYGPRKGGFTVLIDAENARKGVGKTSAAVALARLFAKAFDYELVPEDLTLSGDEYLERYREHPGDRPSVLVLDELAGAGAGDKRRAMSEQNVHMTRAWQLMRTKQVVTLTTLPDWNDADKKLKKLADYRVWCREKPIGEFQAYKVTTPFDGDGVNTKGLGPGSGAERITFPNMDAHDDELYEHLADRKDALIHSGTYDADAITADGGPDQVDPDDVRREEALKTILRAVQPWDDENGASYREAARLVDYGSSWVGDRVAEWRDGKHRNLVDAPAGETA